MAKIKYKKAGLVPFGTHEPSQTVNLQDPEVFPAEVVYNVDLETLSVTVSGTDKDGRNQVARIFPVSLSAQEKATPHNFIENVVLPRLAAYPEFQGMTKV